MFFKNPVLVSKNLFHSENGRIILQVHTKIETDITLYTDETLYMKFLRQTYHIWICKSIFGWRKIFLCTSSSASTTIDDTFEHFGFLEIFNRMKRTFQRNVTSISLSCHLEWLNNLSPSAFVSVMIYSILENMALC